MSEVGLLNRRENTIIIQATRMNFPDWATPSELRMLYSEARTLGADDLTLSDIDAVKGFLRAKSGGNCPVLICLVIYHNTYFHTTIYIISLGEYI